MYFILLFMSTFTLPFWHYNLLVVLVFLNARRVLRDNILLVVSYVSSFRGLVKVGPFTYDDIIGLERLTF